MKSYERKLPKEAGIDLFQVKVSSVKPYTPILGPAYLYLEKNDKFISVKRPLDFFSEKELSINATFEYFYFPKSIQNILPYQEVGRQIRSFLHQTYQTEKLLSDYLNSTSEEDLEYLPPVRLPAAPFQVSSQLLEQLSPLLKTSGGVPLDGFNLISIVALVNEVCDFEGHDGRIAAREKDIELFEKALIYSSWAVFVALWVDYHELNFLNHLRLRVFNDAMEKKIISQNSVPCAPDEVEDLILFAVASVDKSTDQVIRLADLKTRKETIARKIADRIEKRTTALRSKGKPRGVRA